MSRWTYSNTVSRSERLAADLEVEDARENKQQAAWCCRSWGTNRKGQHSCHSPIISDEQDCTINYVLCKQTTINNGEILIYWLLLCVLMQFDTLSRKNIVCSIEALHTYYSKDISDIRNKDGQQQHQHQDAYSRADVNQPGEGTSSKQHQNHSLAGLQDKHTANTRGIHCLEARLWASDVHYDTHREVYKWYSQQHREKDGQPNNHHHDVPGHDCIVTQQQLRVHMSCKQQAWREWV